MSSAEPEGRRSELDALLARRTPDPTAAGGALEGPEGSEVGAAAQVPPRGRLERWLRGSAADEAGDHGGGAGGGDAGGHGIGERDAGPSGELAGGRGVAGDLREIPVDAIRPSSYQPRQQFDEAALGALAESIRELGVLQPVLVRPDGEGRFELVAGERRWRAARAAGLRIIPVLVRQAGDQSSLEQAIVENLHRQDLNPLEEAAAYQQLAEDFGLTQEDVARRVGKSRSAVTNTVRLLQLSPPVQRLVGEGLLSAGHARALLAVEEAAAQRELAERVVTEELSVRQTEEAVRRLDSADERGGAGGGARDGGRRDRSAASLEVERLLGEKLETQVEVRWRGGGGHVVVRFADVQDLDRIVRSLVTGGGGPDSG